VHSQPNEKYAIKITTSKKHWFASSNDDGLPDLYTYDEAINIIRTLSANPSEHTRNQQYAVVKVIDRSLQ
jgi:hypothetical protein